MSPRTSQQWEVIRNKSREKIVTSALELFATKGLQQVSMENIARHAGVSKGLTYNYFKSREELIGAVAELVWSRMEKDVDLSPSNDPVHTLETVIKLYFKLLEKETHLFRLFIIFSLQLEDETLLREYNRKKFEHYSSLFTRLLKEAGISKPKSEALLITALFDGIGMQYLALKNDYPLKKVKKSLINKYCNSKS